MGLLSWIMLGLIVGALAKWIMPRKEPAGCLITIFLGIGGAFVGGYIGSYLGFGSVSGFSLESIFLATGGAVLLLYIHRVVTGKNNSKSEND